MSFGTAEDSPHEFTQVIVPHGAKPVTQRRVRGIGVSIFADLADPNAWPEHGHPTHWLVAIFLAPARASISRREGASKAEHHRVNGGHVWLLPPGWKHTVRLSARAPVVFLYIEARSVREHFPLLPPRESIRPLFDYVTANQEIADQCSELHRLAARTNPVARWQIAAVGTLLAVSLLEAHIRLIGAGLQRPAGSAERIVDRAKARIAADLTAKPPGEAFARSLGISGRHLRRLFLRATGKSLKEYVRFMRTKHAVRLLRSGSHNVKEAAEAAGFSDTTYLNRCTQKYYSVAPSAFLPRRSWPPGP